ncbi:MAG: universal stress protein [Pseudomonadota bacterium]
MTIEAITAATDLSERSDRAVRRAADLARQHGATLTVLNVVDADLPDDLEEIMIAKTREKMAAFVATLDAGSEILVDVRAGDPVSEMIKMTHTMIDLFVVGTHRRRGFFDAMWETTVQKVVRHAPCPVLLVCEEASQPYDTAILATDFSRASSNAARMAATLVPGIKLEPINALHVPYQGRLARSPGAAAPLEAAFMRDAEVAATSWRASLSLDDAVCGSVSIQNGSAYGVIKAAVEETKALLLAIGAHGRAGAMPAVLGSIANDLLREPPCDILILR